MVGLLLELPLFLLLWVAWIAVTTPTLGDFVTFRDAGDALLHGRTVYVEPTPALLAENDKFVYPAPLAALFVPFALMPLVAAELLFLALSVAALLAALKLLGVTDWRCYGVVFLTAPVITSTGVGAIAPFLLLGLAVCWRYRTRAASGAVCAVVALAKLFLWPALIWLIATRRFRAAAVALATIGVLVGAWILIDADGLRDYPRTLDVLNDVMRWKSYSGQSLAVALGLGGTAAEAISVALALTGIAAVVVFAARADGERRAFIAAVATGLLATPILWLHYLVLLLAPIALVRPRLSPLWFAPMAFWLSPHMESLGSAWRIAYVLVVTGGVVVFAATTSGARAATSPFARRHGRSFHPTKRELLTPNPSR